MARFSGPSFTVFLVDQFNLIASTMDSASMEREAITQQTNPFGVGSEQHSPTGLEKGALSVGEGVYDPATDALHGTLGGTRGLSRLISAAIEGNIIGNHFMGFAGALDTKYKVMDKRDGLTMANADYLVSGLVEDGVIVQSLATFTASWDTKTGGAGAADAPVDYTLDPVQRRFEIASASKAANCVITTTKNHGLTSGQIIFVAGNTLAGPAINGSITVTVTGLTTFTTGVNTSGSTGVGTDGTFVLASTVNGGSAYMHCTALSVTSLANKIMHSPDDSTYAALATFTTLVAVGKQRVEVAAGTTVDRFLSNQGTVVGVGNVGVFAGFCRN